MHSGRSCRNLIRIDIDPEQQLSRNVLPDLAIHSDAALAVPHRAAKRLARNGYGAAACLGRGTLRRGPPRVDARSVGQCPPARPIIEALDASADDVVIVGDSTLPVYSGNRSYEARQPRSWFNAGTGYGTLGFALPAAIGAKLAAPERAVICAAATAACNFRSLNSALPSRRGSRCRSSSGTIPAMERYAATWTPGPFRLSR